jgi:hypothetical protein
MFYLALPEEINARVQETATQLKYINEPHYNQTIELLRQHQPIRDAKKMMDYTLSGINKIHSEILNLFINTFNVNLKNFSKGINIKLKTDINAFFEHWLNIINNNGDILFKKNNEISCRKIQHIRRRDL